MRHKVPGRRILSLVFGVAALCAAFFVVQFLQIQSAQDLWAAIRRRTVKAALTSVTLNNGNGNVVTGNDVTSQTTALSPDTGAYRWVVNGSNYMALNMPFNESGTQNDFSGNGNNGSPQGTLTYLNSGCKVGSCVVFNGTDGAFNTGSSTTTKITGPMTIALWIKLNGVYNLIQTIASNALSSGVGSSFAFEYGRTANKLNLLQNGNTIDATSTGSITDDNWHHVAMTRSGSTGSWTIKFYIDGALDSTVPTSANPSSTPGNLYIGKQGAWTGIFMGSTEHFNGTMDEMLIVPTALSDAQILQLYNDGNTGNGAPTIIQSEDTTVGQVWDLAVTPITSLGTVGSAIASSNPVVIVSATPTITGSLDNPDEGSPVISSLTIPGGSVAGNRWSVNNVNFSALSVPFNSGASVVDVSGNGITGTPVGNAVYTTSGCKVGGCYAFDGNGDSVNLGTPSALQITTLTVEAWIKRNVINAQHNIIVSSSSGWGFYVRSNNLLGFTKVDTSEAVSTGSITDTNWHHVALTYNGTTARFYIDGVAAGSPAYANPNFGSSQKAIGIRPDGSTNPFNGLMDEVRVYPRVLSQAQIYQNYLDGLGSSQSATDGVGGPIRISAQEHALGETWDLVATEILSDGTVGPSGYIDSATIITAATTTPGITTPSGTQTGSITINYSCSDTTGLLRDFLVEFSTNGGGSFANATLVSTSTGSLVGANFLSMVSCNSGTSNHSFVWNSLTDVAGNSSTVQIRITAQYPGGPSATTSNFTVDNGVNLCTAGGEASGGLTASELSFDNTTVQISGCTLSIDGAHTFTNLFIRNSGVLTQTATTTSVVTRTTLAVTGQFSVESGSSVNMDARGFPLGYTSNGSGGVIAQSGVVGNCGGSHGGMGGCAAASGVETPTYDSLTEPNEPGAGAFVSSTGSAGGGHIKVTAGSMTIAGSVVARGGGDVASTGAGGSIYLISSGALSISSSIVADGGSSSNSSHGAGGGGRIAVKYSTAVPGNPSVSTVATFLFARTGTPSGVNATNVAAAGTIYIEDTSVHSVGQGQTIVKNISTLTPAVTTTTPLSGTIGSLTILDRASVLTSTMTMNGDLVVQNLGRLTHELTTASVINDMNLTVTGLTDVQSGGSIDAAGRGFLAGYTSDGAGGIAVVSGATTNSGGSHGGRGGIASGAPGTPSLTYDSVFQPSEPGSGAGNDTAGAGGGYIRLITNDLTVAGTITADGLNTGGIGASSSGAGGGIWITVSDAINLTGTIRANGGGGPANNFHGYGGGGRIAFYYSSAVGGNASVATIRPRFAAASGSGSVSTSYGSAGTVYIEDTSVHAVNKGEVYLSNVNLTTATVFTPLAGTLGGLNLEAGAKAILGTLVVDRDLSLSGTSVLLHEFTNTVTVYRMDVTVGGTFSFDGTSSINLDTRGFPLGYTSNGAGGVVAQSGTSGNCGGSHGGEGGCVNTTSVRTPVYDSIFAPADPGAGAFVSSTGSAGGGYVKITTQHFTFPSGALITANGGAGAISTGAGGGVYIIATGNVSVAGTIRANGGGSSNSSHGAGAGGRVAFKYSSAIGSNPTISALSARLQAFGGLPSAVNSTNTGAAGTVYIEDTSTHAVNGGAVYVDNNNSTATLTYTPITGTVGDLIVENAASLLLGTLNVGRDFLVSGNSFITHSTTTTSTVYRIDVTVGDETNIASGSIINVDAKGFPLGYTTNGAGGVTAQTGVSGNCGGAYGGRGGCASGAGVKTPPYGDFKQPVDPGSGAFISSTGSAGGGYAKWTTGVFVMAGTITANGGAGAISTGAGGGIWITATGLTQVTGTIRVNGGGSCNSSHGCGAGGRIALYYDSSISGSTSRTAIRSQLQAFGGVPSSANATNRGGPGTIYIEDSALHSAGQGDLRVNNNNSTTPTGSRTPLFISGLPTTYTLYDIQVINLANLVIDTPCAGTPALTVLGVTDQSGGGIITNLQGGSCTVSQSPINITTTTLPGVIVGGSYNQTIQSAGGIGPHTFQCVSGGTPVVCTTVLPPGLDMSSAGVITGTATTVGTYPFAVRATEASPGVGTDDQSLSIGVGNAPTAPTTLFVHNTNAQLGNTTPSGIDGSPVFSAIFNDSDTGETASKYRVQVASDAGFTTLLWDSGASGTAIASCAIGNRCANINYAGSALSLNGTTYYWRIKFWDSLDIEGVFSATNSFSTDVAPTAPTVLFSNDATAQTGLTNPVGILAAHPVFSAIYNDPDGADTATKYRIQVDNNNNFASPVWDSGAAGTSMASCNQGNRCADIVFGGADLSADETVYYWRIKFFDAANVESPWSEDPIATTKFTMGIAGGSSQQTGTEPPPQATIPETPIAGAVQVLDANSVRYNWIDTSNNETGFRILNAEGNIVADVGPGVTQAVETNLSANSVVEGRKVLAYNAQGQSPTSAFASAITAAPVSRPVLVRRGGDSVTFTIEPVLSGLSGGFPGQTAVKYELLVTNSQGETRTVSSEWIQQNEYTFEGISSEDRVEVRVVVRNQQSLQNEPTAYENVAELSRRFAVSIGVFEKGTNTRSNPINPNSVLSVSMRIESIGSDPASSVVLNLPLPRYVLYRTGTMSVDGRGASEGFDGDAGQADQNGVAASWATMNPGESHSVAFELAFDVLALQQLRASQEPVAQVLAQALAAANPIINLQASVSFADSDVVYMSPVITLEPDLGLTEVPVIPEEEPEIVPPEPETAFEELPVTIPTPEETSIIEQILQQEFGTPTPQPTVPGEVTAPPVLTLQTGETITSSDSGSFNVDVTSGENTLGLTGSATVAVDTIQFSGTTTQPFTVITLIFNDSITAIAVSDANGFWQTFVSADRLGIKPGEEATVKIEAIAAKGDLRSERVSVGEVLVSRGRSGDIEAEFETTVSSTEFVTAVKEIQKEVTRVIEKQEPIIQTTLSVAAPVIVVSSVPLWGYLPYAPTMIYHLITYVIGAIGRKKKMAARFYGVAYDSISKQPLALAIIRIYKVESALPQAASVGAAAASNKKLVTTVVTDKAGRYDALLEPGQYTLEVAKPGYMFPSQIVSLAQDGDFQNVYSDVQGITVQGETITIPDVPLDPVNAARQWQLATGPKKLWYSMQKVGGFLAVPILLIGAVMSALVVITIPDKPINWIIAIFYIVLLSLQIKLRQKVERAWGVVYDIATNAVLPLTTIQLIEPASSKVVTSRLSDYQGRFAFLPEPGTYVIKASKAGYQQVVEVVEAPQTDRQPLHGEVRIEKPDQRINGDIAMRQGT